MTIDLTIDGKPVTFSRDWFTGRVEVIADGHKSPLQNPWNPETHISLSLIRVWETEIYGHSLFIEKTRPLLLAGFRPHAYRVFLDGNLIAERSGY